MIGRICQREVDTVAPGETVCQAAQRMQQRAVGTLLVLDDEERPMGIVTDRDLVVRALAHNLDGVETRVDLVMTTPVVVVGENVPIEAALERMRAGGFRRMPVVDAEGRLVGLAALDDILGLLAEEFTDVGLLLQAQAPGNHVAAVT